MGWWEKRSDKWKMVIVAQVGAAAGIGVGAFIMNFKSPEIPVEPKFLAFAGGLGVGGSVGSSVSIPWSAIVRQLINPKFSLPPDSEYTDLKGKFSCQDIQREKISFVQATASVVAVGAQFSHVTCEDINLFGPDTLLFKTTIKIPKNLPEVGSALLDLPQIQGGFGAGTFAFVGTILYIGT